MAISKIQQQALEFITEARTKGYAVTFHNNVVTITKWFVVGNREQYIQCDMEAPHIMALLPVKKGYSSTWGTTGDGIGGHVALERTGRFELNRSAVTDKFMVELRKLIQSGN